MGSSVIWLFIKSQGSKVIIGGGSDDWPSALRVSHRSGKTYSDLNVSHKTQSSITTDKLVRN